MGFNYELGFQYHARDITFTIVKWFLNTKWDFACMLSLVMPLYFPFTIVKWDFILYVLFHTAFYTFLSQL